MKYKPGDKVLVTIYYSDNNIPSGKLREGVILEQKHCKQILTEGRYCVKFYSTAYTSSTQVFREDQITSRKEEREKSLKKILD